MNIEIYDGRVNVAKEPVRLAFEYEEITGRIKVIAVDVNGKKIKHGNLITFLQDGTIIRNEGVNSTLGFQLDGKDRIKIND